MSEGITVVLGSHTFTIAPQPSESCALLTAILSIPDGYNRVHIMGKQNPQIVLTIEEVSQAALNDLVDAYNTEAEVNISIPNFEVGDPATPQPQPCRIENLTHKVIPGVPKGTYYQVTVTLTLTTVPSISYVQINPPSPGPIWLANFGPLIFPINPRSVTNTHTRQVVKQNILGLPQKIYSKNVNLKQVEFEGVLTGPQAMQIMYNLKAYLYTGVVQQLITPEVNSPGETALLTELTFSPENIYHFEQLIPYTAKFIIVPDSTYVKTPSWSLQIQDANGVFQTYTDIASIEIDRAYGGQAASFRITLDNSSGQYALGTGKIDYMRNLKVGIQYVGSQIVSRIWGIVDEIDYSCSKDSGSTVQITGRDYLAYMMEGWLLDDYSYMDWLPLDIVVGRSDLPGHGLIEHTPIGNLRITGPNWNKYWAGVAWTTQQVANNTTRAELLQKISALYRQNFYMDAGELPNETGPNLVWAEQPRISCLTQDAIVGATSIHIDYPLLFQQWVGETIIISDTSKSQVVQFTSINGDTAYLNTPLTGTYLVANASAVYSYNQGTNPLLHPPLVKTWGVNIISITPCRLTGIPLRNRTEVYGDGVYAIADASQPTLLPSGSSNPGYIGGSDPGLQTRYGKRRDIIEDSSIKSISGSGGINCEVYAYTNLVKTEYPDREIHINCEGDPTAFPGAIVRFTDNGYTGLASGQFSGYLLTATSESLSVDGGYTIELVLSKLTATISPALLTNVLKTLAANSSSIVLNNSKMSQTAVGIVLGQTANASIQVQLFKNNVVNVGAEIDLVRIDNVGGNTTYTTVAVLLTNAQGIVVFNGLPYGQYYGRYISTGIIAQTTIVNASADITYNVSLHV